MKAVVLRGTWDLGVEELQMPVAGAGEVLIKVAGAGACRSEAHQIKAKEFPKGVGRLPKVLGHEASGTIVAVGDGVSPARVGERVVVPFLACCGSCEQCLRGRSDLCGPFWELNRAKGSMYDGTTRFHRSDGQDVWMDGPSGMAEYTVAPSASAFRAPDSVDLAALAIMGCAAFTAFGALRHGARLEEGQTVVVSGAGGVGTQMIQIACVLGASQVVAIDVGEEKLNAARSAGATSAFDAYDPDTNAAIRGLTGGGADVVLEAFGHPDSISRAIQLTRRGGRAVLVGVNSATPATEIDTNDIIRRQITVAGSYGARPLTDVPELMDLVGRGLLDPASNVSRRARLEEAAEVYRALEAGEIVGRVVIQPDSDAR